MRKNEEALKVSVHLSEGMTHRGAPSELSILDYLFYRGVSGASVLKGIAGFGADHHLHAASALAISDQLPIKVVFIESPEKVAELLPKLRDMAGAGMIEVHQTTIVKAANDTSASPEPVPAPRKMEGKAKLLRIYMDERDRWHGKPLHEALVEALRANDIAGATVYKAILGYGRGRDLHKKKMFSEGASIMLSIVDAEERIREFMPILDKMMPNGLAVLSDVEIITYRPHSAEEALRG
jgi:PII-like signaling protein